MALWEFSLARHDGTVVGQTVVAEGATESEAAAIAAALTTDVGAGLSRPGRVVPVDAEKRWREISGDVFPIVVSGAGRLALYARTGKPSSSCGE